MAWVEQRGPRYRVRFRNPDGTVATDSSHPTRWAAELRSKQVDIDQATDSYLDPARGRITLAEWVTIWERDHIAGPARWAAYRSQLRNHILPRYGDTSLTKINRQSVKAFVKHLKTNLQDKTVSDIIGLLSHLMREAVADRRLGHNPCHGVRVITGRRPERPVATATQINAIAGRADQRCNEVLIITAAYTGMRWGELTGLARPNVHLGEGLITVHPDVGALHEVAGKLYLGPPKTPDSVRDVHLPPFLIALIEELLDDHDHDLLFCGPSGAFLRRSNMSRRVFRPAVDGDPRTGTTPIIAGMHFHDLRHTHKTWLIEDGIPEVVQAKRLGHRMAGVRGIYSHVTPAMTGQLVAALEQRWHANRSRPTSAARHLRVA